MKFRSKIDTFHFIATLFCIAVILLPLFFMDVYWFFWIYLCFGLIFAFMLISITFFTYYVIEKEHLKICAGFIKLELNYNIIINIKTCKNLVLSFATSIKRIEINFGASRNSKWNKIYVSPFNEITFIDEMSKRCLEYRVNEKDN